VRIIIPTTIQATICSKLKHRVEGQTNSTW